jgi:hypothetical protein
MTSLAYAALSELNFSSDDSSSSEEDEKVKCKPDNFTGLCIMGKSSRHISDSDSDISDDLCSEILSLRVIELENALCNQDKLLYMVFHENKMLNLELESVFSEIVSLRSAHDDMSAKPCDNCTMIMVSYADLWLLHSRVASLLDGARLELRELKACSTLLGACTTCPLLRSDLEVAAIEIKDLKHWLDHPSLREKMIEEDLSMVEESATKSTYNLGVGFERCEDKGEKSAPKFILSSTCHQEEKNNQIHQSSLPIQPKTFLQP